jgi:Tol biopolymer transport system component
MQGACGGADIYFSHRNKNHGWLAPENLGCQVNGPLAEAGPSYFEADGVGQLYFSSGPDIYASIRQPDGTFGSRAPVAELNSASNDLRPNVRKDGLEVVFDSDRPGSTGLADLWFATRSTAGETWSTPANAGPSINTTANETRGSFSRDGSRLYFGRSPGPEGGSDIFTTSRLESD